MIYRKTRYKIILKKFIPMTAHHISAIDIHAHYGVLDRPGKPWLQRFGSCDAPGVAQRAKQSNIQITVVSPLLGLMPRGQADACTGNEEADQIVPTIDGLRQWVIIDPKRPETFDQAQQMLSKSHCVGIKIHPEEHLYPIVEHGQAIFEFAAKHEAVVLTHSGQENSMPEDFVPFANDHPNVKLILAHIGCSCDEDLSHQVRAVQMSKHGNIFADTSSASNILPGLIEWAVSEIGAEKVLFGTDSPLYDVPMQRARINEADLNDHEKQIILRDNALKLLDLKLEGYV